METDVGLPRRPAIINPNNANPNNDQFNINSNNVSPNLNQSGDDDLGPTTTHNRRVSFSNRQDFNPPLRRNNLRPRSHSDRGRVETSVNSNGRIRMSHMYVIFSSFVALLAIVSPPSSKTIGSPTEQFLTTPGGIVPDEAQKIDSTVDVDGGTFSACEFASSTLENDQADDMISFSNFKQQQQKKKILIDVEIEESVAPATVTGNCFDEDGGEEEKKSVQQKKITEKDINKNQKRKWDDNMPRLLGWILSLHDKHDKSKIEKQELVQTEEGKTQSPYTLPKILRKIFDPSLLQWTNATDSSVKASTSSLLSQSSSIFHYGNRNIAKTTTEIIDKILNSNMRLFAIANLLLAVTFLLHSAVADLFLNESTRNGMGTTENGNVSPRNRLLIGMEGGVGASASNRINRSGRERLGGYLLFKLLLVSAVVEPGTLDLLILLSWYTLLSFLKSLSYLAGVTTAHASASGQSPQRGVLKLLLVVLIFDITAALLCAALFHGAGLSMVLLLTCDCMLLAVDVLTHLTRYSQQVLEDRHQARLLEIEGRQIQLHAEMRNAWQSNVEVTREDNSVGIEAHDDVDRQEERREGSNEEATMSNEELREESRQFDHEMEMMEAIHSRRLAILDHTAFVFDLLSALLTIAHFLHIWFLHGISFNLVDGVLALHLHTAISAAGKKIVERRNHNRIARDLDSFFEDATELEMRKASAVGDVCCICLGTMSMGNVKKVACGHLYHTNCLREVVERARSVEAARCPLCRASVINGMQFPSNSTQNDGIPGVSPGVFIVGFGNSTQQNFIGRNVDENVDGAIQNRQQEDVNRNINARLQDNIEPLNGTGIQNVNERPLFRFSTEGILPTWLPIPAFSFEVVRRQSLGADMGEENGPMPRLQAQQQEHGNIIANQPQQQQQRPATEPSFFRRLLVLAGAVPMSPEQEAVALSQLVDMFPQYDRSDLLRELRERGSSEGVVEAVLSGLFSGIARPGAV